jgi:hypothetical protein
MLVRPSRGISTANGSGRVICAAIEPDIRTIVAAATSKLVDGPELRFLRIVDSWVRVRIAQAQFGGNSLCVQLRDATGAGDIDPDG